MMKTKTHIKPMGLTVLLIFAGIMFFINALRQWDVVNFSNYIYTIISIGAIIFLAVEMTIWKFMKSYKSYDIVEWLTFGLIVVAFIGIILPLVGVTISAFEGVLGFLNLLLAIFVIVHVFKK